MAGDSAAVSEMHRPGLLHRLWPAPAPPQPMWGLPCGHRPGRSMSPLAAVPPGVFGAFALFWAVLSRQVPAHPAASPWHPAQRPPPGEFPNAWVSPGTPILGSLGSPRVPRPLGPLGQPPCSQSQLGCSPTSEGAASWPAWAGRRPARGQVLRVWAGCLLLAAGEGVCGAQSRGLQVWPGEQRHHHPACCRLWATPGYLGS